jgi:hypothetical protein
VVSSTYLRMNAEDSTISDHLKMVQLHRHCCFRNDTTALYIATAVFDGGLVPRRFDGDGLREEERQLSWRLAIPTDDTLGDLCRWAH